MPQVIPPFSVNVLKFCYVLLEDIEKQIPLENLKHMVLIVWECDDIIDSTGETENMPECLFNTTTTVFHYCYSTDDDSNDSSPPTAPPHTIVFKCIGATQTLYKLSGWSVPVRMSPQTS